MHRIHAPNSCMKPLKRANMRYPKSLTPRPTVAKRVRARQRYCTENVKSLGSFLVFGIVSIVFGLLITLRLLSLRDEAGSRS